MSHADGLVGVAVSLCNVGIDLELRDRRLRKNGSELKLAKRYFSDAEVAAIEQEEDEEARRVLFIRLWTLKEAYVKATGRGIGAPPGLSSFTFSINDEIIKFCPGDNEPGRHASWKFGFLEPIDGSLVAVCIEENLDEAGVDETNPIASQHFVAASDFLLSGI